MGSNVRVRFLARAVSKYIFTVILVALLVTPFASQRAGAAEYAALVMDARNGKVLHASNADTRLHPASLTKMMTLYIAFEAVKNGELTMDTVVTISRKAASEPPSRLGLKAGQKIKLRYLVRAAAVKSANDAATAIGEAIEGSEAAFARRMNRTAKAMGMSRTTFKNAHGLTESGHLSTARDMSVLGRHVFYDYPEYYNLFSRKTANAGVRTVSHTNARFLDSYRGADGIKTGYTSAAGFNLTASAQRGSERIITTVFGGRSTATRNARVAELMDLGFKRASTSVAVVKPARPPYMGKSSSGTVVVANTARSPEMASKIVRAKIVMTSSPLPKIRPLRALAPEDETLLASMSEDISNVVAAAQQQDVETAHAEEAADIATAIEKAVAGDTSLTDVLAQFVPKPRPANFELTDIEPTSAIAELELAAAPEVVTRMSTSGSRHWGIKVGTYGSEYEARKILLKTALTELDTLDGALRKVVKSKRGFDANFLGLTEDTAALTCRKLQARGAECSTIGPSQS